MEWYKESGGFHNVLHSVSGDLLLNRIVSVKVLSLAEDIPSLYDAVVIISGKKYPMDDDDFTLGLNGLLVQLFVEYLEEPKLPMVHKNSILIFYVNLALIDSINSNFMSYYLHSLIAIERE